MFSFFPGTDALSTVSRSTSGASEKSEPSESEPETGVKQEVEIKGSSTTFEDILGPRKKVTALMV
jgi:hypothetical protein